MTYAWFGPAGQKASAPRRTSVSAARDMRVRVYLRPHRE
ncbi:hypothetical protein BN903_107 [Halorubrum sp. AJ67]|nr:hypothetical protein BN903_107 [Halorubrum sp. AJ67]